MAKITNEDLLAKINELALSESNNSKDIEYVKKETSEIKDSVADLTKKVEDFYVNQDQFWPVKTMVYGLAGGILLTVMIGMLSLVVIPRAYNNAPPPAKISLSPAPSVLPTE